MVDTLLGDLTQINAEDKRHTFLYAAGLRGDHKY